MATSAPERSGRPARPQLTLTVLRREQLSEHLVRVVVGGEHFDEFKTNDSTDKYIKIAFAKPELGLVPPYDLAALRESGIAPEDLPVTRTYTVRKVDSIARELWIDFVVHGDEGVAGPWANSAKPGDAFTFGGPGGGYEPDPEAEWHLFAGDLSALPAITSALEALPRIARGLAFIEAHDENDVLVLDAPPGVAVQWLFSGGAGAGDALAGASDAAPRAVPGDALAGASDAAPRAVPGDAAGGAFADASSGEPRAVPGRRGPLAEAVAGAEWLPGRPQVFAHGERGAMKQLRDVFRQRGVLRSELSLSGYWAEGRTEDRFQAEKREPIGAIPPVSD